MCSLKEILVLVILLLYTETLQFQTAGLQSYKSLCAINKDWYLPVAEVSLPIDVTFVRSYTRGVFPVVFHPE